MNPRRTIRLAAAATLSAVVVGSGCSRLLTPRLSAARQRPTENVSPAPEVSPQAVVWRTPEPPAHPQAGDVWVNPKDGADMVYVSAGQFIMGSSDAELEALSVGRAEGTRFLFANEQPQFRVSLRGYWIGRTEVTNAQYQRFLKATGHRPPDHWKHGRVPAGQGRAPVVNVDWFDASAYCKWAGGRLPTEMEWEKAARGRDGRAFPWGNEWDSKRCLHSAATASAESSATRHRMSSPSDTGEGPAPVGSYTAGASPYGCQDMAGNVGEWCADTHDEEAYYRYASGDLTPPATGERRVLRGGSWNRDYAEGFRCAFRGRGAAPGHRCHCCGFRCARTAR